MATESHERMAAGLAIMNPLPASRPLVQVVLSQHAEDAVILHATRSAHTTDPHVKLEQLGRFDERLAAHLDGLQVAGEAAGEFINPLLETPSTSAGFVAAVLAIESRNLGALDSLYALGGELPEVARGIRGAFGWVEPPRLKGIVADALNSPEPLRRLTGIAASGMHRVDPGLVSSRRLEDGAPAVRARALRTAGELGQSALVSQLVSAATDDDLTCRFWAAWSAVLLGDRNRALGVLKAMALEPGPFQQRALDLALLASTPGACEELLRVYSADPAQRRLLVHGIGLMGDPKLVPWLIQQMEDDTTTRLAGEAFSLITGADLAWLDLERKPPEGLETGPDDDPDNPDVGMDPDDGLPWPDVERVNRWWEANAGRFTAGERHFMGQPPTPPACVEVLKQGYQRQRVLAAFHRSLLQPGTALFEWRAPAPRQQRALAMLGNGP